MCYKGTNTWINLTSDILRSKHFNVHKHFSTAIQIGLECSFKPDSFSSEVGITLTVQSVERRATGLSARFRFPAGERFLFFTAFRLILRPTQPPIQWVQGECSPEVKRPKYEDEDIWGSADVAPLLISALDGTEWSASLSVCFNPVVIAAGALWVGGPQSNNIILP
jgi:hypothetical protein